MQLTADGFRIFDGMKVWLDGLRRGVIWGIVQVSDEGLEICFADCVCWEVAPTDLYATEAAAIAALRRGGVSC